MQQFNLINSMQNFEIFYVFRLTTVEVIQQKEGNTSTLRVQVAAISCDECGAIPWDELQVSLG